MSAVTAADTGSSKASESPSDDVVAATVALCSLSVLRFSAMIFNASGSVGRRGLDGSMFTSGMIGMVKSRLVVSDMSGKEDETMAFGGRKAER